MSYRTREQLISDFLAFETSYPKLVSHEIIGKSFEDREILLFKIGNLDGGRVMFDAGCHGNERSTSEVLYYYVKWLLEKAEAAAERILEHNLTLIVPIVNMDGFPSHRKTMNFIGCDPSEVTHPYSCGVDLNRNFGWRWCEDATSGCAGVPPPCSSHDPVHPNYCGPSAESEPENQAILSTWAKYKPKHYINFHCCGFGPIWFSQEMSPEHKEYVLQVIEKYRTLANERNQPVPTITTCGGKGCFDCTPYHYHGIFGWSLEVMVGGTPYEEIPTKVLQNWLPLLITLSQESEVYEERTIFEEVWAVFVDFCETVGVPVPPKPPPPPFLLPILTF